MGILSKNLEYNNGSVIDFEIIKKNRVTAVKELSEGNIGLEELLNFCIDNNIRTHSSCGDRRFQKNVWLASRYENIFN